MECVNLRSAAVLNININKYSNLKKKFITDLGIKIMDPFAKTLRGSIPGGAVYRHRASARPIRSQKRSS